MKRLNYIVFFIALTGVMVLQSCSPAVTLSGDQYLLKSYPAFNRADTVYTRGDTVFAVDDTSKTKFRIDSLRSRIEQLATQGSSSLDYDILYYAIKSRPNRKMLVVKPYLAMYNIGVLMQKNEYKFEKIYKWFFPRSVVLDSLSNVLIRIGEKPVVIDTAQLNRDAENLRSVYYSNGYFHPVVTWRVNPCKWYMNRQQARVEFLIDENELWIIDSISIDAKDPVVRNLLDSTRAQSLLQRGEPYNEDKLTAERGRIATLMRNNGYFKFKPGMVEYEIDTFRIRDGNTTPANKWVTNFRRFRVVVKVTEETDVYTLKALTLFIEPSHMKITDYPLIIRPADLSPEQREEFKLSQKVVSDTLQMNLRIYKRALNRLNVNRLSQRFGIHENSRYNLFREQSTLRRMQELGIFRFTLINYEVDDSNHTLNATLHAQLTERYQLKAGIEVFSQNDQTLRSNLPGFGGNLTFRDKMFFKGAEHLEITTNGNLSFLYVKETNLWRTFFEFGGKVSFIVPRLMLPYFGRKNMTEYNPFTNFSVNLNAQNRSLYNRIVLGVNWNYTIYHNPDNQFSRSSFSPYIINFIQSHLSPVFLQQINAIDNDFLRAFTILDFQPRFSSRLNYKYTWSNYTSTRAKATAFFQPSFDMGGNTPYLIDRFFKPDSSFSDGRIDSIFYGQFFKLSTEYKRYHPITRKSEFVWRVFAGAATPWNYSTQVPFDARFFSGGTNGMRGWASNTLGPGIWNRDENLEGTIGTANFLISPGGEVSFEANAELRANVYKYLELAIFTDVGNCWFLPNSTFDFDSGKLSKQTFYQLGWDIGLGFRFDFSFFIFRIDLAQQLYAPDLQDFVIKSFPKDLGGERWQLNFGVGYPF